MDDFERLIFGIGEVKTKEPGTSTKKKKRDDGLPKIGEVFYYPRDAVYYDEKRMPCVEFRIEVLKVKGYVRASLTEVILSDGATPYYFEKKKIGKVVFKTREEAIAFGEKMADEYDQKWEKYDRAKARRRWREK